MKELVPIIGALLVGGSSIAGAPEKSAVTPAPKGWPSRVKTVHYPTSADNTDQPTLIYIAASKGKRPLLVGLHTWSSNYTSGGGDVVYARWCIDKDWYFIHPNFRGPNNTPHGCGSEMAVQDIVDAVDFMKKTYVVDADRIYLVGVSGGGYMSLLMAGRTPDIWAGISAWASISDIRAWWEQKKGTSKYATHIEHAVAGRPDQSDKAAEECVKRSALTYLDKATRVNLDISAGVTDGHGGGSVPFTHSLYAFNKVAIHEDRIAHDLIEQFYEKQALPDMVEKAAYDPLYGGKQPIFRKISNNARVTIFQGSHEIIHNAALNWLAAQRRGKPAVWDVNNEHDLGTSDEESASGK